MCVFILSILDASLHRSVYVGASTGVGHTGRRSTQEFKVSPEKVLQLQQ